MFFVYSIISEFDGRIYVGMSTDVEKRLIDHNSGGTKSTKSFRPWRLFFVEEVGKSRVEAREREKYYKSGCGKEYLKKLVNPR